jgi:hypothetical protein
MKYYNFRKDLMSKTLGNEKIYCLNFDEENFSLKEALIII